MMVYSLILVKQKIKIIIIFYQFASLTSSKDIFKPILKNCMFDLAQIYFSRAAEGIY